MPLRFQFIVPGDDLAQIDVGLAALGDAVVDLRPAWAKIHPLLLEAEREQFDSEGRRGSGGWAPLKRDYAAYKRKVWGERPKLVASGKMRAALTTDNGDHVAVSQPLELRFGVVDAAVPYAKYHQSGYRRGSYNVPARKPIELTAGDRAAIVSTITETVRDAVIKARRSKVKR